MADTAMFPLEARGLGVRLGGHDALRGVDLVIDGRSRIGVLGANGAGKSVLLRALHGLITPTEGAIRWGGFAERPRAQAMVFQRPVMLRRSALANVTYGLALAGVSRAKRERRAREVLDAVGLTHVAARPARVLSGGEQQKLALARAWALEPEVLFLDEPTANLDPGATREVERIVDEIHASGTKIVMTTHNLGQARRLADEILFMSGGRLADHAPVERFFAEPSTGEAAAFIKGELPWS